MNKDFPSALFDYSFQTEHTNETIDRNAERENVTKLSYSHPLTVNFTDDTPQVITQKFYSSHNLEHAKLILPWSSPNDLKKNNSSYDIYSEIDRKNDKLAKGSLSYYYADCKNNRAKFYPNLLNTASQGKCFLTCEGYWLTPLQFQAYSGSTASDWKSVISLNDPFSSREYNQSRKRKKKHQLSIKKLLENRNYKLDSTTSSIQTENMNLIDCLIMNSGKNLIIFQPNISSPGLLDASVYTTQLESNLFDMLFELNSTNFKTSVSHFKQTFCLENSDVSNYKIKQVQSRIFDDEAYYFNNRTIANNVKEAFVALNLSNTKLQAFNLNLKTTTDKDYFEAKLLYDIDTLDDYINAISTSHLISGETAVLLEKSGDIHLLVPDMQYSKHFNDKTRIATDLKPLFESKHSWKSVYFGAQPRQFIYSDYSQVVSIDLRIKTSGSNMTRELFKLSTNYVGTNELINRTQIADNDCFYHLICCSNTFLIIDERYTKNPLLTWKHHLNYPAMFLDNLFLMNNNKTYQHYALINDAFNTYVYQFCVKQGMLVSCNFPYKLDSPIDVISNFPKTYDKRLDNQLKNRLNEPLVGFKPLRFTNSFALFQMLPSYDVFYQCYETTKYRRKPQINCEAIYSTWLTELENQVLADVNISLESDFNELSIGNKNKSISSFNLDHYLETSLENEENLNRCLYVNSGAFNTQTKLTNINESIDFNQNELTQSLFSIWNENI